MGDTLIPSLGPSATELLSDPDFQEAFASPAAVNPVQVTRTSGNLSAVVSAVWADLDSTGTAAARTLDVVLPNMSVGDNFIVRPIFTANAITGGFLMTCAVIVGGAVQRNLFDATYGFFPWAIPTAASKDVNAPSPRLTVVGGDLENGSLRLRLRHQQATNPRVINAVGGIPFFFEGRGPLR